VANGADGADGADPIGRISALHVWSPDDTTPAAVDIIELDWGGAPGDRHHGLTMRSGGRQYPLYSRGTQIHNYRQLSIIDTAELDAIAQALGLPELAPGTIAENITTSGLPDLTSLPPMTRLAFGDSPGEGAVIVTGGENDPCVIAGRMVAARYASRAESFPKAAIHRRGLTGWVEHPGPVRIGDRVTVL